MLVTDQFLRLELSSIKVLRDVRQRRRVYDEFGQFINNDGLLDSIRERGVLQPIIINEQMELKAGERRLEASRALGLPDIICRFIESMSPVDAELVELTENLQRLELPWRDEVAAIARLHELKRSLDPAWTREDTAKLTNYGQIHEAIRVARDLTDVRIAGATTVRMAFNILARRDDRLQADALNDIMEAGAAAFAGGEATPVADLTVTEASLDDILTGEEAATATATAVSPPTTFLPTVPSPPPGSEPMGGGVSITGRSVAAPPPEALFNESFLDWAPQYIGPKFNFIHCDFPYGINAFGGEMSGRDRWETYDDDPDVYWKLIQCLCVNLDKLLAPSGHLMFWTSADVALQIRTLTMFERLAPSLEFWPKPLVWHKTDNVGILSDPKRKPRHVYETALVASREDRLLAQATSDCYGSPTNKEHHPSTKPEPMLRYFFQMFVDEHTQLLDPTCGGGSALRAAESLGAKRVVGLEVSPEHFENAQKALRKFRALRRN